MKSFGFFIFMLSFLTLDSFGQLLPSAELIKERKISQIIARSTINLHGYEIIEYTFDSSGTLSQTNSSYISKTNYDRFTNKVYYYIGNTDSIVDSTVTIQKGFYRRIPTVIKKIFVYDTLARLIREDQVVYNYVNIKDKWFQVRVIAKSAENQVDNFHCGLGQRSIDNVRWDTFPFIEPKKGYLMNEKIVSDTVNRRGGTIITTKTASYGVIGKFYFLEGLAYKWENYSLIRFDETKQIFEKKREIYQVEVISDSYQ